MPGVIVAGGGLAGMAAAAALAGSGFRVTLLESRGYLGGRASSYPLRGDDPASPVIDNSQHILLGCCHNLRDFFRRLGVADRIRYHREFNFLEPGGRFSVLRPGPWPAPWELAGSFARLRFLGAASKFAVARALAAASREYARREDLDRITMRDWLAEKRQPEEAVRRFWRPVLVSALNAEPESTAARYGLQVFRLAFLGGAGACDLGVPAAPLSELYSPAILRKTGDLHLRLRTPAARFRFDGPAAAGVESDGEWLSADAYVCALPFERLHEVAPELGLDLSTFRHSPITAIHLWFDRPVTALPHAALLDRTIQWMFSRDGGRYVQLVVSASAALTRMSQADVVALVVRELAEFLPEARRAAIERARVVKELRATFTPAPGLEGTRPASRTRFVNLFLAGDWTASGWPATMEGAVRSGYLAAEAVTASLGAPRRFLLPDPA
jgi:zeta-carotene desaturase